MLDGRRQYWLSARGVSLRKAACRTIFDRVVDEFQDLDADRLFIFLFRIHLYSGAYFVGAVEMLGFSCRYKRP
jgi:hypothetical protein